MTVVLHPVLLKYVYDPKKKMEATLNIPIYLNFWVVLQEVTVFPRSFNWTPFPQQLSFYFKIPPLFSTPSLCTLIFTFCITPSSTLHWYFFLSVLRFDWYSTRNFNVQQATTRRGRVNIVYHSSWIEPIWQNASEKQYFSHISVVNFAILQNFELWINNRWIYLNSKFKFLFGFYTSVAPIGWTRVLQFSEFLFCINLDHFILLFQ